MSKTRTLSQSEIEELDRFYRAGGLAKMASPHVHYQDSVCPHSGCEHQMEWIDFRLELFEDAENIYKPLVRSWWEGTGFVGRCPKCDGWIRFTALQMQPADDESAGRSPRLPEDWHTVAQFA